MTDVREQKPDRWRHIFFSAWSLVGIGVLLVALGWVFSKIAPALIPFLLAIILIYLFRAPVAWLEGRGMKRGTAVGVCYIVMFAVVGTALGFLVPPFIDQVRQFIEAFPSYYNQASEILLNLQNQYNALVVPSWVDVALANIEQTVTERSAEWSAALAKQVFSVGGSAVSFLGNAVFSLIVAFWVLKDLPIIVKEAERLVGPHRRDEARTVLTQVSNTLGGYLRGQLIISAATAVVVGTGLSIAQVPYSILIAVFAGLLNVIPWIGPTIIAIVACIAAATIDPWHILFALMVCLAAQELTDWFVQPKVMSEQVDLHPLLVIFSLLVGGALFGFIGLILAIPVAAIAKALFVYYFEKYTHSKLATTEGALFRTRSKDRAPAESVSAAETASVHTEADRPRETSEKSEENDS